MQQEMKAKMDFMTGREEGMHEGLQVGRYEGKREVARKMLIGGMSLFSIRKFTGLKDCDIRAYPILTPTRNTMNKPELMRAVSEKADISQTKAGLVINAITDAVTHALAAGDAVSLVGFGTFEVKSRAERPGRNPKTGEAMTIPAARVPAFRAGKALKEAVR